MEGIWLILWFVCGFIGVGMMTSNRKRKVREEWEEDARSDESIDEELERETWIQVEQRSKEYSYGENRILFLLGPIAILLALLNIRPPSSGE